jgi:cell wall-associated NlpC family hydrolase
MVGAMPAPAAARRSSRVGARRSSRVGAWLGVGGLAATLTTGIGLLVLAALSAPAASSPSCAAGATPASIALGAAGGGARVGATEYGGPGDPSSGTVGASGADLLRYPDSYAELGGLTFQTATAMGGLPYMTPLRVTWAGHSAIAYKRDFGLGGGPVDGLPRVIDLWWQFAGALHIPYEDGQWSGPVRIARPPASGAGNVLEQSPAPLVAPVATSAATPATTAPGACGATPPAPGGLPTTTGPRAELLPSGQAAAPAGAPAAVRGIIAAGNQIAGKPYVYGGGHGLPLDQIAPAYDCSSSVEHLLYGGGLLPVSYDAASGALESFGLPGPGRWVTIYASADHVFMYVAGLRWDTHNAAGPGDGSTGIGWHPLIRESAGFVVRHPVGL